MLTEVIFNLIAGILLRIDSLIPALNLSSEFVINFSVATDIVIDFIAKAGYFLPLDAIVNCITVVIVVKNYKTFVGFFKWVFNLVRGGNI